MAGEAQWDRAVALRARAALFALWLLPALLIGGAALLVWQADSKSPNRLPVDLPAVCGLLALVSGIVAWWVTHFTRALIARTRDSSRARDNLAEAVAENKRLLEVAERQTESLQALARRVGEALSSTLDTRRIAELVIEQAIHVINCDRAVITLRDRASDQGAPFFRVLAAVDSTGAGTRELLPEGSTTDYPFLETVFASERVAFIADAASDERLSEREKRLAELADIRSMMIAPMRSRDYQVIGLLILTWIGRPYSPSTEEFAGAETLAAQAALAIESAGLYSELSEAQRELRARLEAQEAIASREAAARSRIDLLLDISQKLNASLDAVQINEIVVRGAFELAMTSCDLIQVALFRHEGHEGRIRRVARFPRPKPIRGRASWPLRMAVTEDAALAVSAGPTYQSLYVKRQPVISLLPGDKSELARFDMDADPSDTSGASDERIRAAVRLPLVAQGEVLGHISLYARALPDEGEREGDGERTALLSALSNLASLAAISLYNAQLYERVQQRAQQMTTLWSVGKAISAHLAVDQIADTLCEQVRATLGADLCVLSLYEQGRLAPQGAHAQKARNLLQDINPPDCECDLVQRDAARRGIPLARTGVESMGPGRCRRFGRVGLHSVLAVPLIFDGESLGVVSVFRSGRQEFGQDEIDLINTLGSLSVVAIKNARSYEHEHHIAETLQSFFLTASPADVPGFEIGERYYPASQEARIGGDYFDFIPLGSSKIAILIGDISGKGLTAAVYTAMAKYTLRAFAATTNIQPSQVVDFTNLAMTQHTSGEIFSTLFYGVLDFPASTLTYVNAGHEPPLLLRRGVAQLLEPTGLVVGALPESCYEQKVVHLEPGDVLALYTDGLTDSRSPAGVFFTNHGAAEVLKKLSPKATAVEMADALYAGAREFSGGAIEDDVALLVVKVL